MDTAGPKGPGGGAPSELLRSLLDTVPGINSAACGNSLHPVLRPGAPGHAQILTVLSLGLILAQTLRTAFVRGFSSKSSVSRPREQRGPKKWLGHLRIPPGGQLPLIWKRGPPLPGRSRVKCMYILYSTPGLACTRGSYSREANKLVNN